MLEALRRLRDVISSDDKPMPPGLQSRLRSLPLWTTAGWVKGKGGSAFAVADSGVERGLTGRLPPWKPGGNVQQFKALFGRLRVTPPWTSRAPRSRTSPEAWAGPGTQPWTSQPTRASRKSSGGEGAVGGARAPRAW
ncbi:hypothetical protein OG930_40045 [Streptomyces sp. NBC_01799]|uniref:hypothetical protein n=1 Tax=Streptomyces sp. NBC_01800 TaxID=2975945 RepID=UPI002DD87584|nr:hypothetical protein [Streptomyces sp. NBC_01800]WSA72699.1 hypothetical protein OIE65_40640 [Streptomyces sp. NBC_01800]WSA81226.1 hypothetical protein OG930_40045 [Streptomyces sp. NBC_01799]